MSVLAIVALTLTVVFAILQAPRDWRGSRPILSAYVIALIAITLYILLPAFLIATSGGYTWAVNYYSEETFSRTIWMCNLAVVMFLYGNFLARRWRGRRSFDSESSDGQWPQKPKDLLLYGLLAVGLTLKIVMIIKSGGFADSISRMSGYARQFSGVEQLDTSDIMLRTISGIADGAATWGVLRALKDRHREKTWLLILFLTLMLSYATIGKRIVLLLPLACIFVGIHNYRRVLTTKLLPIVLALVLGIGFLTLIARVFLPASSLGYSINLDNVSYANGSVVKFYFYSLEFSTLEMISIAMASRQDIINLFGGTWDALITTNIEPFAYSVPRFLWPGKPSAFYDLSYGFSAELGYTSFDDPTVGFASTLIGTSYLMGGIIFVIISMFSFGFLTGRIDSRLARRNWTDFSIVVYAISLVIIFHLFRQGTLGWTFIVAIVSQYGTIAALLLLSLGSATGRGTVRHADAPAGSSAPSNNFITSTAQAQIREAPSRHQ